MNNKHSESIWNIYHHVLIDETSLKLLRRQAAKLKDGFSTVEDWNDGIYGRLLRFCNSRTFSRVVNLWNFYALDSSHGLRFTEQQKKLEKRVEKANKFQKQVVGNGAVLTGLRSTHLVSEAIMKDVSQTYRHFWESGTSAGSEKADHTNPLFGTPNERLILHYGTEPFLGYHLATAYMPIAENSPLKPNLPKPNATGNGYRVAFGQFCTYAKAFRTFADRCVIRFANSDALAFCHALQHLQSADKSEGTGWYSDNWSYEPLSLDSQDYTDSKSQTGAPLLFDMVDTSNLVDHLGCLNLLVAASPLLKPTPMSTMCMEMLVLRNENIHSQINTLVSGDLAAVSLLFGLTPVQYWTGTTAACNLYDSLNEMVPNSTNEQSRFIMCWKSNMAIGNSPVPTEQIALKFDARQLAVLVYRMYLDMFKDESWENRLSTSPEMLNKNPYEHYTRAGLSAILRLIKNSNFVDWVPFIGFSMDLILNDPKLQMGSHYIQGLILHLHMLRIYDTPEFQIFDHLHTSPLRYWKSIPSQLCITLVVPRQKVAIFRTASPQEFGSPIAHIMLESATGGMQNTFPDIQLGFGKVETSGKRFTENFGLQIRSDERGWDGTSPLVVSVMVPTWIVLLTSDLSTRVVFALKSTPHSLMKLGKHLGMFLDIYRSTLISEDVFITQYRPNMSRHISICAPKKELDGATDSLKLEQLPIQTRETKLSFHVELDEKTSKVKSLTTHVDLLSTYQQEVLRGGATVLVKFVTPHKIMLEVNSGAFRHHVDLPMPLLMTGTKTRVARKSSYIEFIAPVASPEHLLPRPDSIFPIGTFNSIPLPKNVDYLKLDQLPIIDTRNASKLQWLIPSVATMFSGREKMEREKHTQSPTNCRDARVNFKDSLSCLFMRFAGVQGGKHQGNFGLYDPDNGGYHILILPSELRLDISNQSVVLDAAMISLTPTIVSQLGPVLALLDMDSLVAIAVNDEELRLWSHALPSLVERCRHWTHTPTCEYNATGNIPLSTEPGQPKICSCGIGKFPSNFKIKDSAMWDKFKKHAVRVAISPCYFIPFVENASTPGDPAMAKIRELSEAMKQLKIKKGSCANCGKRPNKTGGALLNCGRCKAAQYCSKECQAKDWKTGGHKEICKALCEQ